MKKVKIEKNTFISCLVGIVFLVAYYIISFTINERDFIENKSALVIMSWIGILQYIYILWSHKASTDKLITPYTIFVTFLYIFNFGQCFLWAFGIFTDDSILNRNLYNFSPPSLKSVFITQWIVLVSAISFHCGFLILSSIRKKNPKKKNNKIDITDATSKQFFFYMSLIVIPISFYKLLQDYIVASNYGYRSLYYGEHAGGESSIITIIYYWFFPCIAGLLLSGNGKNKKIIYLIFAVFTIISLAMGERGSWAYAIFILAYLWKETSHKKIKVKKVLAFSILGYIGLYLVSAIKKLRNVGISISSIANTLSFAESPILEFITELGTTMTTTLVLVEKGWNIYPYGDTFLLSVIGVVSSKVFTLLGINYVAVSSWFSQTFLNINYGAGFSIITEVYMNYGPILLPMIMMLFGLIFAKIFDINNSQNKYIIFKNAILLNALIRAVRGTSYYTIKEIFWGAFLFLVIYKIFYTNIRKDNKKTFMEEKNVEKDNKLHEETV